MQRSTGEDGGMRKIQMMPTEEPSVEESQVEQAPAIAAEGESVANSERFLNNEPGHARMETVAQSMSQAKDAVVSRVKNTWGGVKGTLGKIGSFFSKDAHRGFLDRYNSRLTCLGMGNPFVESKNAKPYPLPSHPGAFCKSPSKTSLATFSFTL